MRIVVVVVVVVSVVVIVLVLVKLVVVVIVELVDEVIATAATICHTSSIQGASLWNWGGTISPVHRERKRRWRGREERVVEEVAYTSRGPMSYYFYSY